MKREDKTNKGCGGGVSGLSSLTRGLGFEPLLVESHLCLEAFYPPPQCGTFRRESECSQTPIWIPKTSEKQKKVE